jgi:WD40 repeat protein
MWDLKSRKRLWKFAQHQLTINALAFSPNEARILVAAHDGIFQLLDAKTGALVRSVQLSNTPLLVAVWLGADHVLVGSRDGRVRRLNAETAAVEWVYPSDGARPYQLWASHNHDTFLLGQRDGMLRTWSATERGDSWPVSTGVLSISSSVLSNAQVLLRTSGWEVLEISGIAVPLQASIAPGPQAHGEINSSNELIALMADDRQNVELLRRSTGAQWHHEQDVKFGRNVNGFILDSTGHRIAVSEGASIALWKGPPWVQTARLGDANTEVRLGAFSADGTLFYGGVRG